MKKLILLCFSLAAASVYLLANPFFENPQRRFCNSAPATIFNNADAVYEAILQSTKLNKEFICTYKFILSSPPIKTKSPQNFKTLETEYTTHRVRDASSCPYKPGEYYILFKGAELPHTAYDCDRLAIIPSSKSHFE